MTKEELIVIYQNELNSILDKFNVDNISKINNKTYRWQANLNIFKEGFKNSLNKVV